MESLNKIFQDYVRNHFFFIINPMALLSNIILFINQKQFLKYFHKKTLFYLLRKCLKCVLNQFNRQHKLKNHFLEFYSKE